MKKRPAKSNLQPNQHLAHWRERILPILPVAADHGALVLAALRVIRHRVKAAPPPDAVAKGGMPGTPPARPKVVLAVLPAQDIAPVAEGPWPDDEALMARLFATLNDGPTTEVAPEPDTAKVATPIRARRLQVVPPPSARLDPAVEDPTVPMKAPELGDVTETRRERAKRTATELLGPMSDRVISWLWLGARVVLCFGALLWLTAVLAGAGPVALVLFGLLLLGSVTGLAAALLELAIRHQDNRQVEIGLQARPDPFERLAEQMRGNG